MAFGGEFMRISDVDMLIFELVCLAGSLNREQQLVIEYLLEEVKITSENRGRKRLRPVAVNGTIFRGRGRSQEFP